MRNQAQRQEEPGHIGVWPGQAAWTLQTQAFAVPPHLPRRLHARPRSWVR